ncbi:MAG TPA: flippase [Patescibacteria group bacterium]|jgi:O-antigen/teichoic acid export membrane protein
MAASATKKIAYNTAVQAAGKLVVMFIGLVSVAILTRYLGADGYGKFTLALVYLSFFGIAADMGLFTIAVREMSRNPRRMQEIVSNTLVLRALLATVVFSLAVGIGWLLPYEPDVKVAIGIAAGAQFFGLLNSALISLFQTKLIMGRSVIADLVGRVVALGAVIGVIALDWGFYAVVATAALGSFVTFLVSTLLVREFVSLRLATDTTLWKKLLKESVPYGAALVILHLYLRVDIFLLSLMRSTAEVGVYGVIFKVYELVMALPGFFNNSVFPVLVRRLKSGTANAEAMVQKVFDALVAGGAGVAAGGIVLAPQIMQVIGGSEFVSGADALQIILVAILLSFAIFTFSTLFVAMGHQSMVLRVAGVGLVLNVILNLLLIPKYGINGSAVATVASEVVVFTAYYVLARRSLSVRVSLRTVPRIFLAAAIMAGAIWPFHDTIWLAVPVGAAIYGLLLVAFRVVTKDILRELKPSR